MENKNYYDWLEVSPKASPEVIEKAYKALVIKYHPDLNSDNSVESKEIMQNINEAYDVLSDSVKRAEYDKTLKTVGIIAKQGKQYTQEQEQNLEHDQEYNQQIELAKKKAYHDAYIEDLKNRGYKIRYKKSFKDYIRIVITVLVIFIVIWLLWKIPFIHNYITDLSNENKPLKIIVDLIKGIYEAFYETIF